MVTNGNRTANELKNVDEYLPPGIDDMIYMTSEYNVFSSTDLRSMHYCIFIAVAPVTFSKKKFPLSEGHQTAVENEACIVVESVKCCITDLETSLSL